MPFLSNCDAEMPSMLNLYFGANEDPCKVVDTNVSLNWNGDGWSLSGRHGDLTLLEAKAAGFDAFNNPLMTLRWDFDGCDSGVVTDPIVCQKWISHVWSDFLDPLCIGLPPSQTCGITFDLVAGQIRPNGKPPKRAPLCSNVPPELYDCCMQQVREQLTGGGSCGSTGACRPPSLSSQPVRYATGEMSITADDLETNGYGLPWGHTRSFSNRQSVSETIGNGFNWQVEQWPYLVVDADGNVTVQGRVGAALWFNKDGEGYTPEFNVKQTLQLDESASRYKLIDLDGTVTEFDSFTGMFRKRTNPGGDAIEVKAMADNGYNFTEVERSYSSGGSTTIEQFLYDYDDSLGDDLLTTLTLRRQLDGGAWENVSRVVYTYYGNNDPNGGWEDLKTVTTQTWNGSSWTDTGSSYYRYYLVAPGPSSSSSSSSSASGESGSPNTARLLKYVINPVSYARMTADGYNPLTASDALLAQYADFYYEYDADRRVTREIIQGGSRTFDFSYAASAFADGYNSWKTKTVEIRPDGAQNIVYSNYAGQTMLSVLKEGDDEWYEFFQYDDSGLLILQANSSAISGYDETKADLLNEVAGNYQYLRDNAGLVRTFTNHAPTGWIASESLQEGELGTSIKLREFDYVACHADSPGSSSSSSSSSGGAAVPPTYFLSQETVYPSDTDQTKKIITSYAYTWYPGTCHVEEKVTTLPVVPTDQNGSGTTATRRDYFDTYGNLTWQMDERGFIARMKFDIPTGAVTQQVDDVDTSVETDAPSGWVTPSGGGLNLVTDFEHDDKGRLTQALGPSHTIDLNGTATVIRRAQWMIYAMSEDADEVRTAQGYATGTSPNYTYTLVNPVSITKTSKQGNPLEQIQATRASTSGKLLPTDTFAQSSYTRWTTNQYTDCCHLASTRVYHTIPTSGEGLSGANYDQTDFGYDVMKRRNRHVTPGGTITFNVFDVRDLVTSTYVGTDDTGATDSDPTGGGAPGNNMVIISGNQYDSGNDSGDGNLTKQTLYVNATDTRVTDYTFDWRNRQSDEDGEIDFYAKTYYDNLDRVVKTERYDTTSGGNLIARSETKYDDRGKVYQQIRYAVDPSTGTVGNSLTDNTWYDATLKPIKQIPSGSDLFTKTVYDSLGRATKKYRGYDLDETTYGEAETVTGDTILQQIETLYDDGGNSIQSTTRQRYHNAPASQTGELKNPSETPKARVTYTASYPDAIGRGAAMANYGTNGGSALSRSSTIPDRSDDVLVTSSGYDSAGNMTTTTDPKGTVTCFTYDAVPRQTEQIMNCVSGSSSSSSSSSSSGECPASIDTNITIRTAYNADGNVSSITAVNSVTGNQTTQYIYGTTLNDSDVAASTLKRAEIYPDSVDASDRITFEYNRQRQVKQQTDQGGTIHAFDFDKLGRQIQDRVIDLDSGVDGAVRRIGTSYEVRGMRKTLTSYDNSTVGSGIVVNEVEFAYNDFSQLTVDYQSHAGAVNTMTKPKVEYGYADGSTNTVRPTSITYPDGRVITFDYGSTDGIDDSASRIAAIVDDDVSSTHLADYSYLGQATFVETNYTEPDIKWTMVDLTATNDPDTGDIYSGFDRFGRVKDNRWYDYGSSTDVDRIKYGYDGAGNRTYRENSVAASVGKHFDELYGYDLIDCLKNLDRGSLNAPKSSVTDLQFAECWALDETGNWQNFRQDDDGDGIWDLNQDRTANKVNEITDVTETAGPSWITPAYSKAGNMTTVPQPSDATKGYTATYDAWNRLVKVVNDSTNNTTAKYEYDGAQRRTIKKKYTGGVLDETRHLYYSEPSKWQVLEERLDASSDAEGQLVWGLRYVDALVLRDRDTTGNGTFDERLYSLQDANWNTTSIAAASGSVQERYAYSAYGSPQFFNHSFTSRSSSSYNWDTLFAGYHYDAQLSIYHIRHRSYHAMLGQWLQRDPLKLAAGVNLYAYVFQNPLSFTDPFGRGIICDFITSEALACLCAIIEWVEVISAVLNPAMFPQLMAARAILLVADCACDYLAIWAVSCLGHFIDCDTGQTAFLTFAADCITGIMTQVFTGAIAQAISFLVNIGDMFVGGSVQRDLQIPVNIANCFTMFV